MAAIYANTPSTPAFGQPQFQKGERVKLIGEYNYGGLTIGCEGIVNGATMSDGVDFGPNYGGTWWPEYRILKLVNSTELTSLPEKWCIKTTEQNYKVLSEYRGPYSPSSGNYISNIHQIGVMKRYWHSDKPRGYTEITFDQFKRWVLKEEKPNLVEGKWYEFWYINGDKSQQKYIFKFSGISGNIIKVGGYISNFSRYPASNNFTTYESLNALKPANMEEVYEFFPEERPASAQAPANPESLLEEAKRRYPAGTVVKSVSTNNDIVSDGNPLWWDKNKSIQIAGENGLIYYDGKWAEIISKPAENIVPCPTINGVPVYLESTSGYSNQFTKGKIYKVKTSNDGRGVTFELDDQGSTTNGFRNWILHFKPSTKEAYERQQNPAAKAMQYMKAYGIAFKETEPKEFKVKDTEFAAGDWVLLKGGGNGFPPNWEGIIQLLEVDESKNPSGHLTEEAAFMFRSPENNWGGHYLKTRKDHILRHATPEELQSIGVTGPVNYRSSWYEKQMLDYQQQLIMRYPSRKADPLDPVVALGYTMMLPEYFKKSPKKRNLNNTLSVKLQEAVVVKTKQNKSKLITL